MTVIPELDFKKILDKEGFRQPRRLSVNGENEFNFKFPVVIKVSSDQITHKTESGAVITGIEDEVALVSAINQMKSRFPNERLYIEEMETKGTEIIIGLITDQTFGKLVLLGIGGFFSELIRDVTFKKIPIDKFDAEDMINELKFERIFNGYRGMKASRTELVKLLLKVSEFSTRFEFSQIDFNPVFLYEDSYVIIDAKLVQ